MENEWEYAPPPSAAELVQNNFISNALRIFLHLFVRMSLRVYHRYEVFHGERLEGAGPAIIVANHASHLDVLALLSAFALGRINRVRTLAAKDYFFRHPLPRGIAFFFANALPMERKGTGVQDMGFAGSVLRKGGVVIMFPEGTRSPDGRIHDFRPGVGLLARRCNVPVIPVYIQGAYESQKKGAVWPRPQKIRVVIGSPLDCSPYPHDRQGWESIARELETQVHFLKEEIAHVEKA